MVPRLNQTACIYLTCLLGSLIDVPATAQPAADAMRAINQQNRSAALTRSLALPELREIRPENGRTSAKLSVQLGENNLNGIRIRHRSYDGQLVGPVIRVRPGDSLEIHLENNLAKETDPASHGNAPGGFNTTNFHTHGLHVSPDGEADNIFLELKPGEQFDFKYAIDKTHPPGTHWYHPHKHGSAALQVSSGMAGALIVEGGLDEVDEIKKARERILVLQQFRDFERERGLGVREIRPSDVYQRSKTRSIGDPIITAINGEVTPTISMRPGEVQRWRMIHAGLDASIQLNLEQHKLYEIACDGIALGTMVPREVVELHPGYRSDVLVKASTTPGKYLLSTEVTNPARATKMRTMPKSFIAVVQVEGNPLDQPLPKAESLAALAPYKHIEEDKIAKRRSLKFSIADGKFSVNDNVFDPNRIDQTIDLNTCEEWTISAEIDNHPFHIHVNPFEVITKDPQTGQESRVWRDSLLITEGTSLTVRHRFIDFPGWTVLHCHNLDHEDQGMMQAIEIADPKVPRHTAEKPSRAISARGFAALPEVAPEWSLADPWGRTRKLGDYRGRPILFVLHRGLGCPHCAQQIVALAKRESSFKALGVAIVAASPDRIDPEVADDYRKEFGVAFTLMTDPALDVFRRYGCHGYPLLHGSFLIDAGGVVRWQSVGNEPEMDIERILRAAGQILSTKR